MADDTGDTTPPAGERTGPPVVVDKRVMKEALAELLDEIPAFQAFRRGKQPLTRREGEDEQPPKRPRGRVSGPADAGSSGTTGDNEDEGRGGEDRGGETRPRAPGKRVTAFRVSWS